MKPNDPDKNADVRRSSHLRPPKAKPTTEHTVAKRYTAIPTSAIKEIKKAARIHGSQGRALQVATEILIRMRRRPLVPPESNTTLANMTYKLIPRTAEVIEELERNVYKDRQEVFAACAEALKMTDI